ncbi:GT-D fold domain-containing protein [Paenibacillus hexagrammi]|uniref:GT-D fold domain-containing glycosyltransferase n=1 Tax=Paenibacillus hexagrammi TaxID=2908839 RepID=A0ABY3SF71_9BACL|nr:GT-D fold domain-containing glycosyltransferase [Paenibacillus sp. YPD9-1]UJF32075.1 GT-D fold domain-containing glycosyltransferase [Paenibacillus sp. YPD9-1]
MLPKLKKHRSLKRKGVVVPFSESRARKGRKRKAVRRMVKKHRHYASSARLKGRSAADAVMAPPVEIPVSDIQHAYDQGFNQGHDRGFDRGFDKGVREGKHAGGEAFVDKYLGEYEALPEHTVEQIIAAGIEHLRPQIHRLLRAEDLGDRIVAAMDSKAPFSLVRLGDGELLTLAQQTILPIERIQEEGPFLPYAGVHVPDMEIKGSLVQAIRGASVVGTPKLRLPNFQPLAFSIFQAESIDYRNLTLTDSLVNYYLYQCGYLSRITQGRRVLLVGNLAGPLAQVLRSHGVHVVGEVGPVNGVKDISRVKASIMNYDFDIALVSAGISAVMLSEWIASGMGRVAIDFGHLADSIVKGEAPYR